MVARTICPKVKAPYHHPRDVHIFTHTMGRTEHTQYLRDETTSTVVRSLQFGVELHFKNAIHKIIFHAQLVFLTASPSAAWFPPCSYHPCPLYKAVTDLTSRTKPAAASASLLLPRRHAPHTMPGAAAGRWRCRAAAMLPACMVLATSGHVPTDMSHSQRPAALHRTLQVLSAHSCTE